MAEIGWHVPRGNRYVSWNNAAGEERVIENVVKGGALLRVGSEDLLHELSRIEGNIPIGRKLVLVVSDAPTNVRLEVAKV